MDQQRAHVEQMLHFYCEQNYQKFEEMKAYVEELRHDLNHKISDLESNQQVLEQSMEHQITERLHGGTG